MKYFYIVTGLLLCLNLFAEESVEQLIENYSGKASWNKKSKTITFESTGTIYFPWKTGDNTDLKNDHKNHFWEIPASVKKIVINENVTVTGAFHSFADIEIVGKNRKTSVVYGTDLQTWTDKNNPGGIDLKEWYYCQFQSFDGTIRISNLTSLNPFSYHIRSWRSVAHVKDCDFIDNRGGHHNHSDGFSGGDGSTVDNCYFETGDDVFKIYFDNTITNCTINMVTNTVPIQLGWGPYSNGAVGTFKNLTIIGNSGRHNDDNAIIAARYEGSYTVTVNIDGCKIENPNAAWVSLMGATKVLGTVKNADIKIKSFWNQKDKARTTGTCEMIICGTKEEKNEYRCQQ